MIDNCGHTFSISSQKMEYAMRLGISKDIFKIWLSTLLIAFAGIANAAPFTSVVAIGDSLFDGGSEPTAVVSAYKLYGVPNNYVPPAGYYKFKYCDGYTSAEYLAYFMGLYDPSHFFNYAIAGLATTQLPSVLQQIYSRPVDATGLYVIFIGGRDIFLSTISRDQSAENIKTAVVDLYAHGARYFMVLNLPKMSDLPNYNVLPAADKEAVDIAYQALNSALKTKLSALTFAKNIVQVDTAYFSQLITQNARSVGFTDLTAACTVNNTPCATPKTYIYWDDVHFTNATNSYLGASMKSALDEAHL